MLHPPLQTDCCVVGGGPAGVLLSLVLARRGVRVVLLESQHDFDREFRGDTLHASTLDVLDQLGLARQVLALSPAKIRGVRIVGDQGTLVRLSLERLRVKFPFVALIPQKDLLAFLAGEAAKHANFSLHMGTRAVELIEEGGRVVGVVCADAHGRREIRCQTVIGADGRTSRIRKLAGFEPQRQSPPMDVVWFNLSRRADDPVEEDLVFRVAGGALIGFFNRADHWQVAYVILKGTQSELRGAGIEALRATIARIAPHLADRVGELRDWKQTQLLAVEASRVPRWHKPGLLVIGDAAHVMSPVGGVGINYAVMDAVEAANVLAEPLLRGSVTDRHLAEVQRRREGAVAFIQRFQTMLQTQIVARALNPDKPFRLPLPARLLLSLPILRDLPGRLIAVGVKPARLEGIRRSD